MRDAAATLAFAAFLIAVLRLWSRRVPADVRKRRVNVLLGVVLVNSFAAGLTQRELWPFSAWPLVAGTLEDEVTHGRLVAIDTEGTEHNVDYRAWQPLSFDELMAWMNAVFPRLDEISKQRAGAHLVTLAEQARAASIARARIGTSQRFLGPLTAPFFILHPRLWDNPANVPTHVLTGLRYYHETWSLDAHARGSRDVRRQLVFQFPAGR